MRPNISEFSYGYAVTEELMTINRWRTPDKIIAPAFPSLYSEGQDGGGYDVEINMAGIPLFIQFKMSQVMLTRKASEIRVYNLFPNTPFYRMPIWGRSKSKQHDLLLHLESQGNTVIYIAPTFHKNDDFNLYYAQSQIIENSIAIRPSEIGHIQDDNEHSVSYQIPGDWHLCSDPKFICHIEDKAEYKQRMIELLTNTNRRSTTPAELANSLTEFIKSEPVIEILNTPTETGAGEPTEFDRAFPLMTPTFPIEQENVALSYINTLNTIYADKPLYKKANFIARCILGCEVFFLRNTQQ